MGASSGIVGDQQRDEEEDLFYINEKEKIEWIANVLFYKSFSQTKRATIFYLKAFICI